jgi:hypothetical protein
MTDLPKSEIALPNIWADRTCRAIASRHCDDARGLDTGVTDAVIALA